MTQYNDPESGRAYVIRPDSYTDKATGVTHIYARQIVGGIEVADAHVNLNIKDGRVLSFGDSFFPGGVPTQHTETFAHPHADHCAQLSSALSSHRTLLHSPSATQSHIGSHDHAKVREGLATLEHLHSSNCANVPSFGPSGQVDLEMDPRRPLLAFLASALPEDHPELSSVLDNAEEHASKMVMTSETHLLGDHSTLGMSLNNVPGAVSEVKARLVWVQVPSEIGVHLELVHRFEVEMEHNWYETTVTASLPHRIVSVVDWASDSPMPLPPGPPKFSKATYEVFPWGVNDPVE
ncbi:hypothetical protein PAXINDRAFT_91495, partial [Paxillus involutus ATCC 200175]